MGSFAQIMLPEAGCAPFWDQIRSNRLDQQFESYQTGSKPADVAVAIQAANGSAESPVEVGRRPAFRRIRIDQRRNFASDKCEFGRGLGAVSRWRAAPRSFEFDFIDGGTEFRDKHLH